MPMTYLPQADFYRVFGVAPACLFPLTCLSPCGVIAPVRAGTLHSSGRGIKKRKPL